MTQTCRALYDAAFKLMAIEKAIKNGNRKTAPELSMNESMVRRWRKQRGDLERRKKSSKAVSGGLKNSRWPALEDKIKHWVQLLYKYASNSDEDEHFLFIGSREQY
jgi:transposase-like protein